MLVLIRRRDFLDIKFLGGANEVGRSGFLLRGTQHMLLDYGVKVEDTKNEYPMYERKVDTCILSHAHLDHSGYVPAIYNENFPQTIGTIPTLRLAELLIEDSMKINRARHAKPMFFKRQVMSLMNRYVPCNYGSPVDAGGYTVTLHDAGHISGSALSLIEDRNGRRLLYTGDFKLSPQLLQAGAEVVKSDILITESTYATREHPDREGLVKAFIADVKETIEAGGVVLLPVFAVGRAQEMLTMLYNNGLADRTFVDGMAKAATEIVSSYPKFISNGDLLRRAISASSWIETPGLRRAALKGGNIILTTSGMLNGGPVLNYITKLDRSSKIILTGYQVEGTNGRKLLDNKPLSIDGNRVHVKNPVSFYDFSAHAGKEDLHRYVKAVDPEVVICVHGSKENTQAFASSLKEEGYEAHAPNVGDVLSVDFA